MVPLPRPLHGVCRQLGRDGEAASPSPRRFLFPSTPLFDPATTNPSPWTPAVRLVAHYGGGSWSVGGCQWDGECCVPQPYTSAGRAWRVQPGPLQHTRWAVDPIVVESAQAPGVGRGVVRVTTD